MAIGKRGKEAATMELFDGGEAEIRALGNPFYRAAWGTELR